MATVHFDAVDGWAGGARCYENCIFRSETGDRVKLQKVQATPDGRHFKAEIVLLNECEDSLGTHGESATEVEQRAVDGICRRSLQTSQRAEGELEMKVGDLIAAPEDYLVHVCDCLFIGRASGLAARLFEHCPQADVYDERRRSDSPDIPGDVSVHDDRVVNLYAQFAPGPPMADHGARPPPEFEEHFEGLPRGRWDTAEDRLDWFAQCLEALPGKLPAEGPQGRRLSLAVPVGLGCAEGAGGSWPEYHKILKIFARDHPWLRVVLYDEENNGAAEV